MKDMKERMTANSDEKGKIRYFRYKYVLDQYKKAMEAGFYLEAVTLMESIISDRLESRAIYLEKTKGFETLGKLCNILADDDILKDFIPLVKAWKDGRNRVLHEMSKIDNADINEDFESKYNSAKLLGECGYCIFRKIDSAITKSKKSQTNTLAQQTNPSSE